MPTSKDILIDAARNLQGDNSDCVAAVIIFLAKTENTRTLKLRVASKLPREIVVNVLKSALTTYERNGVDMTVSLGGL